MDSTTRDNNPFHNRPDEAELYDGITGSTMLELGNKNNHGLTYKAYFEGLGWQHTSVDWNGQDGALRLDLRQPLNLGTFDVVTNIGTTEHVSEQAPVWRNVVEACAVGSTLLCLTPSPGHWTWHGEWYPTEEFYRLLARKNGFGWFKLWKAGRATRENVLFRATRAEVVPFWMPPQINLFHNRVA